MPDPSPLGDLIRARLAQLGRSVADLVAEMERAGAKVHRQSVYQWLSGGPISERNFHALVSVLDVPTAERRAWAEAAGYRDVLDAVFPPEGA